MTSLSVLNITAAIHEVGMTLNHTEVGEILQHSKPAPHVFYPYVMLTSQTTTQDLLRQVEFASVCKLEHVKIVHVKIVHVKIVHVKIVRRTCRLKLIPGSLL